VAAVETGKTPFATKLALAHAAVVDDFVTRGMAAAMESHTVPKA
jgi:hypothetical protein